MSRATRIIAIVAGVAVLVALFVLLRPGDDEPDGALSPTTPASTTVTPTETETETTPPTTTPSTPDAREIEVEFENGEVKGPDRVEVARGETVRITVTADVVDEVHVHTYDLKADVGPNSPAVITFVADVSGVFEVELEERGVELFQLEVGA